jgi:hypothetical protein
MCTYRSKEEIMNKSGRRKTEMYAGHKWWKILTYCARLNLDLNCFYTCQQKGQVQLLSKFSFVYNHVLNWKRLLKLDPKMTFLKETKWWKIRFCKYEWNINCPEIREYGRMDPSRWPRGTHYRQELALTSTKSGRRSANIVRSRTQATKLSYARNIYFVGYNLGSTRWRNWLRRYATSRKVSDSIPDVAI